MTHASRSSDPNIWTHAEAPNENEIGLLCTEYGLAERFVRDALDPDEIPRVELLGEYTYVITRFAYQAHGKNIETAPVLFALSAERLITVSLQQLPSLAEVLSDTEANTEAKDPTRIMLRVLFHIDAAYDRFIHDSAKQLRSLYQRLGEREVGLKTFIRFVHIEDDLNNFLSSLKPTNTALQHLLADRNRPEFVRHRELVSAVIVNNNQSIQACEDNLKFLDSIRRAYTLVNSHNLDRTIKILTLTSVFISIPTMFFSMYGMNIGLPQQKHGQAFGLLMVICVITVLVAYLVGRKKRIF